MGKSRYDELNAMGAAGIVIFNIIDMPYLCIAKIFDFINNDNKHLNFFALANITTSATTIGIMTYFGHNYVGELLNIALEKLNIKLSETMFNLTHVSYTGGMALTAAYITGTIVSNAIGAIAIAITDATASRTSVDL